MKRIFIVCISDIILSIFLIFFDLISKFYIKTLENLPLHICTMIDIVSVYNYGVSFGLFSNVKSKIFIILLTLTILFYVIYLYINNIFNNKSKYVINDIERYALIFILSGGIGNLVDRLINDAVFDFIDFHISSYHWPAFNVADIFVSIGVVILLSLEIYKYFKK